MDQPGCQAFALVEAGEDGAERILPLCFRTFKEAEDVRNALLTDIGSDNAKQQPKSFSTPDSGERT